MEAVVLMDEQTAFFVLSCLTKKIGVKVGVKTGFQVGKVDAVTCA